MHALIKQIELARSTPVDPAKLARPMVWRWRIWNAAAEEILEHLKAGIEYNPSVDHRVKWAMEWVETLEGTRAQVSPALYDVVCFLTSGPMPLSGKDRAAGEHLETLAQGS